MNNVPLNSLHCAFFGMSIIQRVKTTHCLVIDIGLPWWLSGKESTCQAGDTSSIPGSGRFPGEGNGSSLQYYCLGNSMNRGAG